MDESLNECEQKTMTKIRRGNGRGEEAEEYLEEVRSDRDQCLDELRFKGDDVK